MIVCVCCCRCIVTGTATVCSTSPACLQLLNRAQHLSTANINRGSCVAAHALPRRRSFTGNRPSTSLLLPELSAYTVGQVLALYEHQVAVQVRWGCGWAAELEGMDRAAGVKGMDRATSVSNRGSSNSSISSRGPWQCRRGIGWATGATSTSGWRCGWGLGQAPGAAGAAAGDGSAGREGAWASNRSSSRNSSSGWHCTLRLGCAAWPAAAAATTAGGSAGSASV
jgi:hypothetical protein